MTAQTRPGDPNGTLRERIVAALGFVVWFLFTLVLAGIALILRGVAWLRDRVG